MAITMIDPVNVVLKPFEQSHLLAKLQKAVVCARMFESQQEQCTLLVKVATFDLGNESVYMSKSALDYEEVRETIRTKGFEALTGAMGSSFSRARKGAGHGSTSRAFYRLSWFSAHILESFSINVDETRRSSNPNGAIG